MTPRLTALQKTTLDFVNAARMATSRLPLVELPKGQPDHCNHCVLARALEAVVDGCSMNAGVGRNATIAAAWGQHDGHLTSIALPAALREFISAFDHGEYPDLIEGGE